MSASMIANPNTGKPYRYRYTGARRRLRAFMRQLERFGGKFDHYVTDDGDRAAVYVDYCCVDCGAPGVARPNDDDPLCACCKRKRLGA